MSNRGEEVQQITFPTADALKDVRGISKTELGKIEGHEDEYQGYFLMFKTSDFGLDTGDYVLEIRVVDASGKTIQTERREFSIQSGGGEQISENERWGEIHSATDYAFYLAPTEDSVQVGKNIKIQGFILAQEGYKITGVEVLLIPDGEDRSLSIYSAKKKVSLKKDVSNYPGAESYRSRLPVGGALDISGGVKFSKKNGFTPGQYTLKVNIYIEDTEKSQMEFHVLKRITVTE